MLALPPLPDSAAPIAELTTSVRASPTLAARGRSARRSFELQPIGQRGAPIAGAGHGEAARGSTRASPLMPIPLIPDEEERPLQVSRQRAGQRADAVRSIGQNPIRDEPSGARTRQGARAAARIGSSTAGSSDRDQLVEQPARRSVRRRGRYGRRRLLRSCARSASGDRRSQTDRGSAARGCRRPRSPPRWTRPNVRRSHRRRHTPGAGRQGSARCAAGRRRGCPPRRSRGRSANPRETPARPPAWPRPLR